MFANLERPMNLKTIVRISLITLVSLLTSVVNAQTYSVIYSFTGINGDGAFPNAGVTLRGTALYGSTYEGGNQGVFGYGTVYQLNRVGAKWVSTPLFLFNGEDGNNPQSRVLFGPDYHLYGTTGEGGDLGQYGGAGVVFNLTPPLSVCKTLIGCFWKQNQLYTFDGFQYSGGAFPGYGDLIWDQQGNIYGTTHDGGTTNLGVVYELTPSGNSWQENVVYSFKGGTDGLYPFAGVIFDKQGNLWGTTAYGGLSNQGTVFELTYVPGVGWQKTVVHNFQTATDGEALIGGVVMDSAGNFYGTTSDGGSAGGGTIFELSPSGNTYSFKLLYSLSGGFGCGPEANLTLDAAGNLYGTTWCDGAFQQGNVFKLTDTQNGWTYTSLYDFTGGSDGSYPISNVSIDSDGILYGTTSGGGDFDGDCAKVFPGGCGVVWTIRP